MSLSSLAKSFLSSDCFTDIVASHAGEELTIEFSEAGDRWLIGIGSISEYGDSEERLAVKTLLKAFVESDRRVLAEDMNGYLMTEGFPFSNSFGLESSVAGIIANLKTSHVFNIKSSVTFEEMLQRGKKPSIHLAHSHIPPLNVGGGYSLLGNEIAEAAWVFRNSGLSNIDVKVDPHGKKMGWTAWDKVSGFSFMAECGWPDHRIKTEEIISALKCLTGALSLLKDRNGIELFSRALKDGPFSMVRIDPIEPDRKHFGLKWIKGMVFIGYESLRFKVCFASSGEESPNESSASLSRRKESIDGTKEGSIDMMTGHEFEVFCASMLERSGFEDIDVTKGSGDQGIDILATKDFVKYGFQCKCYSTDIGNKAVQEAYAGKTYYGCHVAVVLTNRYFTPAARDLAAQTGVVLWDRDKLLSMIG